MRNVPSKGPRLVFPTRFCHLVLAPHRQRTLVSDIRIPDPKSAAGVRTAWLTNHCRAVLTRWRAMFGPDSSPYLFPSSRIPETHMTDHKSAWRRAAAAGLKDRRIYDLAFDICKPSQQLSSIWSHGCSLSRARQPHNSLPPRFAPSTQQESRHRRPRRRAAVPALARPRPSKEQQLDFGSEACSQIITFSSRFAVRRLNLKVTPRCNQLQPIENKWRKRMGVGPIPIRSFI